MNKGDDARECIRMCVSVWMCKRKREREKYIDRLQAEEEKEGGQMPILFFFKPHIK